MNISTDTLNKRGENSGRSIISRARGEAGAALVMALLFLLVLAIMVPVAMRMIAGDTSRTGDYNESRRAFYIADAGVEVAKSLIRYAVYDDFLAGPDEDPDTDADNGVLFVLNTDGTTTLWGTTVSLSMNTDGDWEQGSAGASGNYTRINYNDGQFYARVFDNEDENPNDPNDDSDYILEVHVVGVTDQGAQSSIRAAYRKYDIPEEQFPGAVTLVGTLPDITAAGTFLLDGGRAAGAWDISGFKPGNPPAQDPALDTDCDGKNAISLEATEAAAAPIPWGGKEMNFRGIDHYGTDTDADIGYDQTNFTDDSAEELREEVKDYCTTCILPDPPHTSSTDPATAMTGVYGTLAEPQITYAQGNVTFSGEGVGILIVDGDMNLTGQPEWAGIILIGACSFCYGELTGSGNIDVFGAVVIGNSVGAGGAFNGTANIWYSCEGVAKAAEVFSNTFRTVGWNEEG